MTSRVLSILACFVLVGFLPERSIGPKARVSQDSVTTVRPGQPDAETLAGYWEAKDPFARGSVQVGILIKILAHRTVPRFPNSGLVAGPQQFADFDIGFYERTSPTAVRIGWFTVAPDGGASWDGHRLRIKFNDGGPGVFIPSKLRLDVAFDQANHTWSGTYTRNRETKSIALSRPAVSIPDASTRFVGVWRELQHPMPVRFSCIYIEQGSDGAVVAWRNSRSTPIGDGQGSGMASIWQTDGDALGIHIEGDTLTLQEGLYSGGIVGGNLPREFVGRLSPDGSRIIGSWTEIQFGPAPLLQAQPPPLDSAILVKSTTQTCP